MVIAYVVADYLLQTDDFAHRKGIYTIGVVSCIFMPLL
jgi:hypothetical protein